MIGDIELETLINIVYEYYGFDFGGYSKASLKRRVHRIYQLDGFNHFNEFLSNLNFYSLPHLFRGHVAYLVYDV